MAKFGEDWPSDLGDWPAKKEINSSLNILSLNIVRAAINSNKKSIKPNNSHVFSYKCHRIVDFSMISSIQLLLHSFSVLILLGERKAVRQKSCK